jgi:hypothetical protein
MRESMQLLLHQSCRGLAFHLEFYGKEGHKLLTDQGDILQTVLDYYYYGFYFNKITVIHLLIKEYHSQ